jgi:hypothetical protein
MKRKQIDTTRKLSQREIFYFDAGRGYMAGFMCSLFRNKKLSLQEFKSTCQLILVRYLLDAEDEGLIRELHAAFLEGFEKCEVAKEEGLKVIVGSLEMM